MQYTIQQLRAEIFKEVYQVYGVFQDFFGENAVDLQNIPPDEHLIPADTTLENFPHLDLTDTMLEGLIFAQRNVKPFILVYWPRVTVTNENNKSIVIQDLYAKIELDAKGNIPIENRGFELNRATYPMDQWVQDYLHSHIPSIPKANPAIFGLPCLGTGPIRDTINSLKENISEGFDETKWMLFCHELSLYVTVESLTGIPYSYLEKVHLGTVFPEFGEYNESFGNKEIVFNSLFPQGTLKDFILYYLHNGHLAFNYQDGMFKVGMSYFDYMIDISNAFIEYFNIHFNDKSLADRCFHNNILYQTIATDGIFYKPRSIRNIPDISDYVGRKVCTFKGADIKLNILDASEEKFVETTVLSHGLAMYILNNILNIINHRYTNEYTRQQHQDSTTTLPATTGQRICYI